MFKKSSTHEPGIYFSGDTAGDDVEYLHTKQHHKLVHRCLHLLLDRSININQHYRTGIFVVKCSCIEYTRDRLSEALHLIFEAHDEHLSLQIVSIFNKNKNERSLSFYYFYIWEKQKVSKSKAYQKTSVQIGELLIEKKSYNSTVVKVDYSKNYFVQVSGFLKNIWGFSLLVLSAGVSYREDLHSL